MVVSHGWYSAKSVMVAVEMRPFVQSKCTFVVGCVRVLLPSKLWLFCRDLSQNEDRGAAVRSVLVGEQVVSVDTRIHKMYKYAIMKIEHNIEVTAGSMPTCGEVNLNPRGDLSSYPNYPSVDS